MEKHDPKYATYVAILERELMVAMGCTEPIAVAYCAAKARELLGAMPDHVLVQVSGNIIKNVKSVIVPNTDGNKGIETAAAIGIAAGDASRELEVISQVTEAGKVAMKELLQRNIIRMEPLDSPHALDIQITLSGQGHSAMVHIVDAHTNIVEMVKDGQVLLVQGDAAQEVPQEELLYDLLDIESIYDFAVTCQLEDVRSPLERQIRCNTAISEEGMRGDYGASVGKVLESMYGSDVRGHAKAMAAAGSDARMNGCELPVVINSGSGNQGITVSMPLVVFAETLGSSEEALLRALTLSNLIAIRLKAVIGRLSAYCGAVSAGAAAGAGIAYLKGADIRSIRHTIVNTLAITSGIICDGAKASCAAKIAISVEAGILGYEMFQQDKQFLSGDGIVAKGVENTIRNVGRLGSVGMHETDKEIIRIMCD